MSDEEFQAYMDANPLGMAPSLEELERTSVATNLQGDEVQRNIMRGEHG